MKKMKKIFALALAMMMVFALSISASAASITITSSAPEGAEDTTEYTYYEIFRASIDGDNVVYYIPVSTKGTALKTLVDAITITKGEDDDATTIDVFSFTQSADGTRWNVTVNDAIEDTDGEAIATALNTSAIKAAALASDKFAQSNGSAVADNLDPGYYLVTSTLGTKLVLQTLNDVSIATKNSYPTNSKSASKVNLNVGDQITYTITVSIPASATVGETVTVHDTLDSHLAILDDDDEIAASADDYNITATVGTTAVTLSDATAAEGGETFAKSFTITSAMLGQDVVITYKAELLSTAADDTGYVNEAVTNYSDYETVPTEVKVYTFDFDLDKNFTGVADADADDYEATFVLYTADEYAKITDDDDKTTATAISFITDTTGYVKADSNDTGSSTDIVVNGADVSNIRGLTAGVYYLVETATEEGFNLLTDPVVITITDTTTGTQPDITPAHTVSYVIGDADAATGTVTVANQSGSVLPSTGGMGTTIFYIIGAILVIGAGVVLVTRRRMNVQ